MMYIENPNLCPGACCSVMGDWTLSEKYGVFIWQGREITIEEYNRVIGSVIKEAAHAWPHRHVIPRPVPQDSDVEIEKLKAECLLWETRAREQRTEVERLTAELASSTEQALLEMQDLANRLEIAEQALAKDKAIAPVSKVSLAERAAYAREMRRKKKAAKLAAAESAAKTSTE